MTSILTWHFSKDDDLSNGDGRIMRDGETLHVDGEIIPCQNGLHGSKRAIDALNYAQGNRVSQRRLSGIVIPRGDPVDKYAASDMTQLWHADATEILQQFAFWCAVLALRTANIQGINTELRVMTAFANGRGELATAKAAAEAAAEAAWAAAEAAWAAEAAARAARAAWAAAEAAAGAARAAAWDAAQATERQAQNRKLTAMLLSLKRRVE